MAFSSGFSKSSDSRSARPQNTPARNVASCISALSRNHCLVLLNQPRRASVVSPDSTPLFYFRRDSRPCSLLRFIILYSSWTLSNSPWFRLAAPSPLFAASRAFSSAQVFPDLPNFVSHLLVGSRLCWPHAILDSFGLGKPRTYRNVFRRGRWVERGMGGEGGVAGLGRNNEATISLHLGLKIHVFRAFKWSPIHRSSLSSV